MTGRRHSYQCDSVAAAYSAEAIAQQYVVSPHRRLSQPLSPSSLRDVPDINLVSPSSPKKKKKKPKERRRNSKTRGKGNINGNDDESVGADENVGELPLASPNTPSKKKKRTKKNRYNGHSHGVVIIPDCGNKAQYGNEKEVHQDESARFSAVTEPTQLLDDDDFTASTKDASSKDEIKKFSKSPKSFRKKKLPKEKTRTSSVEKKKRTKTPEKKRTKTPDKKRTKTPDKTRTKTPTNSRRSSLTRLEKMEALGDNKNASWGTDTRRASKSFKKPEIPNLAVDPVLQLGGLEGLEVEVSKPPSLKKSNSFHSANRNPIALGARRSSFGSNLDSHTKLRDRPLRTKQIQDATLGLKNETWGSPQTPTGVRRGSHSPELVTLYTSPFRSEKPAPQLRRNVKSFNSAESWRNDPKRDHDIPSILFISSDDPEPGFNEPWDSSLHHKPSSGVRRKETIDDVGVEQPKPRARSAGAVSRRRSSTRQRKEKPPQPLRKKEPPSSNANEKWNADPRSMSNKAPLSPGLLDMLGMSPHSTKKKSPGRLKKTISINGMKSSPSLNSLKNNFKKLRGGATKENKLKAIPML